MCRNTFSAGVLFYLGADLVYQWLIQSSRRLLLLEYLSLIAIALLIINSGFIAGVLIGIVIGCATFALSASRVSAIKFSFDGSEYRSSLDRGPYELSLLAEHGGEIQGMALQSYLFFGSANRLYQHVKALLCTQPSCRFLIFDFRLVTGIDSSATHSFAQIKQAAAAYNAQIVLVKLTRGIGARVSHRAFHLRRRHRRVRSRPRAGIVRAADHRGAPHRRRRCRIAARLARRSARRRALRRPLDRILPAAGSSKPATSSPARAIPPTSMHFILEGRVGIVVDLGEGRTMRVRSLGGHTTIGEMGLITGRPRSATIVAEAASVLFVLDAEAFERIKQDEPALSQALLGYVVSVMSERLSFANRAVGVLQR